MRSCRRLHFIRANQAWKHTDVAYNASDENVSEEFLEDANESVELDDVGWNFSDWNLVYNC